MSGWSVWRVGWRRYQLRSCTKRQRVSGVTLCRRRKDSLSVHFVPTLFVGVIGSISNPCPLPELPPDPFAPNNPFIPNVSPDNCPLLLLRYRFVRIQACPFASDFGPLRAAFVVGLMSPISCEDDRPRQGEAEELVAPAFCVEAEAVDPSGEIESPA